jgi:hypothetical protein
VLEEGSAVVVVVGSSDGRVCGSESGALPDPFSPASGIAMRERESESGS